VEKDVDGFERFSLRMARGLLIVSIGCGCFVIVAGLVVAAGAWFIPAPMKPALPAPPEPIRFTQQAAESWATSHASDLRQLEQAVLTVQDPGQIPPSLASLFPSPPYLAADVWEEFCKVPSEYGCLQKARRISKPSPSRTFAVLFHDIDETLKPDVLRVLAEHLPDVDVERRLGMAFPILMANAEVNRQNQAASEAHQGHITEIEEEFRRATEAHELKKQGWSMGGVWAAIWGFGAVVSASLFVALLAIERHLRALRAARAAERA
jgi:hypothetical protein